MPPSLDPQSNAKSNMQGLGNATSKFKLPYKLEDYVPNWERGGKIKAPTTLMQFAMLRANKIRISQKNNYRPNQSSTRTAARMTTRTVPARTTTRRVPPVTPPVSGPVVRPTDETRARCFMNGYLRIQHDHRRCNGIEMISSRSLNKSSLFRHFMLHAV